MIKPLTSHTIVLILFAIWVEFEGVIISLGFAIQTLLIVTLQIVMVLVSQRCMQTLTNIDSTAFWLHADTCLITFGNTFAFHVSFHDMRHVFNLRVG